MYAAKRLQSICDAFESNERNTKLEALNYRSGTRALSYFSEQDPYKCFAVFDKPTPDMEQYPEIMEKLSTSTADEAEKPQIIPHSDCIVPEEFFKPRMSPTKLWRKPKFEYPFPEVFAKSLNTSPKFEFVRSLALRLFQRKFHDQLWVIVRLEDNSDHSTEGELIRNLFSWDCQDFHNRREVNPFWMDLVKLEVLPEELAVIKAECDMRQLLRYFDHIIDGFRLKSYQEVARIYKEAKSFLHMHKKFLKQRDSLVKTLMELKELESSFEGRSNIEPVDSKLLEMELVDKAALCPIETRYQRNWFKIKCDQYKLLYEREEEMLAKEIIRHKKLLETEGAATRNALNEFFGEIETYKARFNKLTVQFEKEEEEWENKNSYIRSKIEKVKEQKKFQIDEVARFEEEIIQLRKKEAEQREKEEREALEAEALKALKAKEKKDKKAAKKAAEKAKNKK